MSDPECEEFHEAQHEHHVDYPHEPGRLYDCPACEARCHCDPDPGTTACIYEGPHKYGKGESDE
jgi:hypothetical protein